MGPADAADSVLCSPWLLPFFMAYKLCGGLVWCGVVCGVVVSVQPTPDPGHIPPTPSCRPVPFNKIMPAGEHMAVQNFITPFMALRHYDVGVNGVVGVGGSFIFFCPRIFIDVNRSGVAAGGEQRAWPGVGQVKSLCYVLVFKTRSSAINIAASKLLTRSSGRRLRRAAAGDICQPAQDRGD